LVSKVAHFDATVDGITVDLQLKSFKANLNNCLDQTLQEADLRNAVVTVELT